jgi:hypothetical protein
MSCKGITDVNDVNIFKEFVNKIFLVGIVHIIIVRDCSVSYYVKENLENISHHIWEITYSI